MNRPTALTGEYLLSIEDVMAKTSLGKTFLRQLVEEGKFPQPKVINPRVIRWRGADVDAWILELQSGFQQAS